MLTIDQRGDTLVEVLVAVAVMATVTVGVLGIMNRGVGAVLEASERTTVRAVVSEQVELLNYFRDQYVTALGDGSSTSVYPADVWASGIGSRISSGVGASSNPNSCTPTIGSFYLEYNASLSVPQYEVKGFTGASIAPGLPSLNNGIWIEAKGPPGSVQQPYADFIVKSCWTAISGGTTQNLSSAVRLYDR